MNDKSDKSASEPPSSPERENQPVDEEDEMDISDAEQNDLEEPNLPNASREEVERPTDFIDRYTARQRSLLSRGDVNADSQTRSHYYGNALFVCPRCQLKLGEGTCVKCQRSPSTGSNSKANKPQAILEKPTNSINLGYKELETPSSMMKTPTGLKKGAPSQDTGEVSTMKGGFIMKFPPCTAMDEANSSATETADEDSQAEPDSDGNVCRDFLDKFNSLSRSSPTRESDFTDSQTESDSNGNSEQNSMMETSTSGSSTSEEEPGSPETVTADENSQTGFDPENETNILNILDVESLLEGLSLENYSEGLDVENFELGFESHNIAEVETSAESESDELKSDRMAEANGNNSENIEQSEDYSKILRCDKCKCIKFYGPCEECRMCDPNCKFPINAKYCTCCEEVRMIHEATNEENLRLFLEKKLERKECNSETPVAIKSVNPPAEGNESNPRQETVNDDLEILRCSGCNCIKNSEPCRDCICLGGQCNFPPKAKLCTCCDTDKILESENFCATEGSIPNSEKIGTHSNEKSSRDDECPGTSGESGEKMPKTETYFEIIHCGLCLCVREEEHSPCQLCPESCIFPLNSEYCSCCSNL